jgi:hypothetical protein
MMDKLAEEKARSELFNMKMEQIILNDWKNLNQSSNLDGLHDEVSFNDEMMQFQAKVEDGP